MSTTNAVKNRSRLPSRTGSAPAAENRSVEIAGAIVVQRRWSDGETKERRSWSEQRFNNLI
jgi:hypothetical protein